MVAEEIRDREVAAKIVARGIKGGLPTVPLEYAPGNGTLFKMLFVPLADIAGEMGVARDRVMVVLVNFRTAHHFSMTKTAPSYIAEKLGLLEGDAEEISALIEAIGDAE